jgi:hypothetical protein
MLVAELRKTTFLPNIQDDAINALLNLTQGSLMMIYAVYTKQYKRLLTSVTSESDSRCAVRALYQRTCKLYVEESSEVTPGSKGLQCHSGGAAKFLECRRNRFTGTWKHAVFS